MVTTYIDSRVRYTIVLATTAGIVVDLPLGAEVNDDPDAYDAPMIAFAEEFHLTFPIDHIDRSVEASGVGTNPFWTPPV